MDMFAFRVQRTLKTFPYWLLWILNDSIWIKGMKIFLLILKNNVNRKLHKLLTVQNKTFKSSKSSHISIKYYWKFYKMAVVGSRKKKLDKIINTTLTVNLGNRRCEIYINPINKKAKISSLKVKSLSNID